MTQDEGVATLLASSAERFLSQHHSPARSRVRNAAPDGGFWAAMVEQGWAGLRLPEALGGADLPLDACLGLLHEFGRHAVPDGLIDGALLPGALLSRLSFCPATAPLGTALAEGSVRVAVAWQTALGQIVPTAVIAASRSDRGVRVTGQAIQVSRPCDSLLVLVELDGAPCIVHVAGAGGLPWSETRASDGSISGTVTFQNTPGEVFGAGPTALIAIEAALAEASMATAAVLGGIAERALELTVAFTQQRRQFDATIASLQVVQHRLVDLRTQGSLAAASLRKAVRAFLDASGSDETALAISAAKARASDTALLVTRAAVQLHGAMGYTEEADIGIYLRAAVRHAAAYGNASAHRARVLTLWPTEHAA